MDTQNLNAFVSVASLGSFSDAAARLHLTQPAVSKRIAVLETQLNCRLFDRIGRKVYLTEAGRALLPNAQRILQDVDDAQRMITDLAGDVRGPLKLATSHHIGLHRLPDLLKSYLTAYPDVDLDIDFIGSENAYDAVIQGQVELAVVTLAPEQLSSIASYKLWLDTLEFAVSTDHPLAASKSNTTLAALSQYAGLLPDLDTFTSRLVKAAFDQQNLPLQTTMATNYMETLKMLAGIGLGWTVLPTHMIETPLQSLTVNNVRLQRQLGIIHHQNRSLSHAARAFIRHLQATTQGSTAENP